MNISAVTRRLRGGRPTRNTSMLPFGFHISKPLYHWALYIKVVWGRIYVQNLRVTCRPFNHVTGGPLVHWGRLVKKLGGKTKILGGQKVVKSEKCMGISLLLGGTCPGCPPKSMPMR